MNERCAASFGAAAEKCRSAFGSPESIGLLHGQRKRKMQKTKTFRLRLFKWALLFCSVNITDYWHTTCSI